MFSPSSSRVFLSVLSLAALLAPAACTGEAEDPVGAEERVADTFGSFEEFKAGLPRAAESGAYIVEGDILVYNEKDLASYYAEDAQPGALIVNRVNGINDRWIDSVKLNLTYCVTTSFGANYNTVVQAMANAANDWAGAASVLFVHVAAEDATCTASNNNVKFNVQPTDDSTINAASFFPTYPRSLRKLQINLTNVANSAPKTLTGVLRHELGHTLGFRHEHIRLGVAGCPVEDSSWGELTAYDSASVMHYPPYAWPQCNGTNQGDYVLTQKDRLGAAALYNTSNPIEQSEFFDRQLYLDILKREPDSGGFANGVAWLNSCNGNQACLASTRVSIARGILESPEKRAQSPELDPASPNYKSAFVTHCYTDFLQHQPDTAGYNWWLNALNSSGDYNGVVSGFITASEYRSRFGAP